MLKIVFDAEKAIQAENKHDNETVPAHNAEVKAYNRRLAGIMFLLAAPFLSVVFFGIYLVFHMAVAGKVQVGELCVLAFIFAATELFAFALFYILKDDDWWTRYDPNNYPAAVKYHLAVKNKTVLEPVYYKNIGEICLVLEDPSTHIVTRAFIIVRDFEKVERSDISDTVIDLHKEVVYNPYKPKKEANPHV